MRGVMGRRRQRQYRDLSRPIRETGFIVEPDEAGLRADCLLATHYPWKSRNQLAQMLKAGAVDVGGRRAKPATRVKAGDAVLVRLPEAPDAPEAESWDDLVFLYEDEHLVVIDKPSGMAVHPAGRIRHGTLINKLHARYRSDHADADRVPRLGHRLDLDTSGVVLAVLHREADAAVMRLFRSALGAQDLPRPRRGRPRGDRRNPRAHRARPRPRHGRADGGAPRRFGGAYDLARP